MPTFLRLLIGATVSCLAVGCSCNDDKGSGSGSLASEPSGEASASIVKDAD